MRTTTPTITAFCQAIRDLAEAAKHFANASAYEGRDEAERLAIALAEDLVPPKDSTPDE